MSLPNLISTSGRETDPIVDRVGLLRAALLYPPFTGIPVRSVTQAIHDLKLTVGWIRGAIELYDEAVARGVPEARLARGADRVFSPVECLVLAWKRGGHAEFQRVRKDQRSQNITLWHFVDPQPQINQAAAQKESL